MYKTSSLSAAGKLLARDETRRIAANIAKLLPKGTKLRSGRAR